jgi:hypothetical protein
MHAPRRAISSFSDTAAMSAIAAHSANDPHSSVKAAPAPAQGAARPCSLSEAVAAVTEHNLRTEMRRVTLAYASSKAPSDGNVTVPRAVFDDMRKRLRAASALEHALDGGALQLVGFDAAPPHLVCESPTPLPGQAMSDAPACGQPFTQCFMPDDAVRVQRVLLARDSDLTMTVGLRCAEEPGQRHLLHLLPPDPATPDKRWAFLSPLPFDAEETEHSARRRLTKPSLRHGLQASPLQSL